MTPQQRQEQQQAEAARQVRSEAANAKHSGPSAPVVRQLRKAVNRLRKQHYGRLSPVGEAAWRRVDQEIEIAGGYAESSPQFTEAIDDFVDWLNTLFSDDWGTDDIKQEPTGDGRQDVERRGESDDRDDFLGGVATGQIPDAGLHFGIGDAPGAFDVPPADPE